MLKKLVSTLSLIYSESKKMIKRGGTSTGYIKFIYSQCFAWLLECFILNPLCDSTMFWNVAPFQPPTPICELTVQLTSAGRSIWA